jgi:ankyrin repeat protein
MSEALVLARMAAGPLRDAYVDTEKRGWTSLMQLVRDGDEAAVARALDAGGEVDAIAEGAVTALSLACDEGSDAIVAALLRAGADPGARARHDLTVLHLAAAHSPLSVVRRLVEAGASIELAGGMTALTVAIECDRIDVLAYLVTQDNRWPSEAFGAACEHGSVPAMQLLWDRFGADVWPQGSPTALMHAARGGSVAAVHFLVDRGADVNELDLKDDLSPLMLAVAGGRHDAARALLERGASANAMTEWFVTAMRIAERNGDAAMIELLRAHGATPAEKHEHVHVAMPYATYSSAVPRAPQATPLDDALARDDVGALAALDLSYLDSALATAAEAGAHDSVAYLLASGADPCAGRPSALLVGLTSRCCSRAARRSTRI